MTSAVSPMKQNVITNVPGMICIEMPEMYSTHELIQITTCLDMNRSKSFDDAQCQGG